MAQSRKTFRDATVYRAKRGMLYDEDFPQYNCFWSTYGSKGTIVADCWVCDAEGNLHPGIDKCPVPVNIDRCGKIVGKGMPPKAASIADSDLFRGRR